MASSEKYEGRKVSVPICHLQGTSHSREELGQEGAEMGRVPGRSPRGLHWLLLASLDCTPSEKVDEVVY